MKRELSLIPESVNQGLSRSSFVQKVTFVYQVLKTPSFSLCYMQVLKADILTLPLQFVGVEVIYKRQVNVLRAKGGVPQQPTKGDLAVYAAKEMQRYIVSVWSAGGRDPASSSAGLMLWNISRLCSRVQISLSLMI